MIPAVYDTGCVQGGTFSLTLGPWKVGDPLAPVDFTGYTAALQVRDKNGGPLFTATCTLSDDAQSFECVVPAGTTASARPGPYKYDACVKSPGGEVTYLIAGRFDLLPRVSVLP